GYERYQKGEQNDLVFGQPLEVHYLNYTTVLYLFAIFSKAAAIARASCLVALGRSVMRTALFACCSPTPSALMTYESSPSTTLQAERVVMAIPSASNPMTAISRSKPGIEILRLFATRVRACAKLSDRVLSNRGEFRSGIHGI